jgi:hypothetical protein
MSDDKYVEGDEYPHRVIVAMTDKMFKEIKQHMYFRAMCGDIAGLETDILIAYIIKAIDDGWSCPVYLRSLKEIEEAQEPQERDNND